MKFLLSGEFYKMQTQLEKELGELYSRYPSLDPKTRGVFYNLGIAISGFCEAMEELGNELMQTFSLVAYELAYYAINDNKNDMVIKHIENTLPITITKTAVWNNFVHRVLLPVLDRLPDRWVEYMAWGKNAR